MGGTGVEAVHYLLYGLLAALGFVLRWSGDEAMSFFGLPIPPPFAPFSKPAHHLVGEAHDIVGWVIILAAAGHAAAALFHHFRLRDDVLWRMLPGRRARREEVRAPSPEQAART
jgi:cytochrome b561